MIARHRQTVRVRLVISGTIQRLCRQKARQRMSGSEMSSIGLLELEMGFPKPIHESLGSTLQEEGHRRKNSFPSLQLTTSFPSCPLPLDS